MGQRELHYAQDHYYKVVVPEDAPDDLSAEELYDWLSANRPEVLDNERMNGLGDIRVVGFSHDG